MSHPTTSKDTFTIINTQLSLQLEEYTGLTTFGHYSTTDQKSHMDSGVRHSLRVVTTQSRVVTTV